MRTREEILTDFKQAKEISGPVSDKDTSAVIHSLLTLEVLLDIRALLTKD